MFKRIEAENFQRLKKLIIDLDPYVTVLVGRNDHGKSALIRSLRWLLLNKPTGKSFIRWGAKKASVSLTFGKHKVIKSIGASTGSVYKLDGKVYRAFRSDVPPAIAKLFAVTDINFQRQHESVFWFDLTPGQVAKELNKLVDLEAIDMAQAWISKRVRDRRAELEVTKKRLKAATAQVDALSWVPKLDVKLGNLEKLGGYRLKSHRIAQLGRLVRSAIGAAGISRAAAAGAAGAAAAGAAGAAGVEIAHERNRLGSLVSKLRQNVAVVGVTIPDHSHLEKSLEGIYEAMDQSYNLSTLIGSIREERNCKCHADKQVQELEKELEEQLGGRCPTCGQPISIQTNLL